MRVTSSVSLAGGTTTAGASATGWVVAIRATGCITGWTGAGMGWAAATGVVGITGAAICSGGVREESTAAMMLSSVLAALTATWSKACSAGDSCCTGAAGWVGMVAT